MRNEVLIRISGELQTAGKFCAVWRHPTPLRIERQRQFGNHVGFTVSFENHARSDQPQPSQNHDRLRNAAGGIDRIDLLINITPANRNIAYLDIVQVDNQREIELEGTRGVVATRFCLLCVNVDAPQMQRRYRDMATDQRQQPHVHQDAFSRNRNVASPRDVPQHDAAQYAALEFGNGEGFRNVLRHGPPQNARAGGRSQQYADTKDHDRKDCRQDDQPAAPALHSSTPKLTWTRTS